MSNSTNVDTTNNDGQERLTGCVKWFDNSLNYGFVTVITGGEHNGKDVFAHQSNIKTQSPETYRSLNCGECVEFYITSTSDERHPEHATDISGYQGNKLQCENPYFRPRGRPRGPPRGNYAPRDEFNDENTGYQGRDDGYSRRGPPPRARPRGGDGGYRESRN
jgi:cold shock CspA family protein